MSQSKNRRKWSAAKKLQIVLSGMEAGADISELRRSEGLGPTQYYSWKKQLVGSAEAVFCSNGSRKHEAAEVDPSEQQLNRMRAVIAEITAENLELKQTL